MASAVHNEVPCLRANQEEVQGLPAIAEDLQCPLMALRSRDT